MKRGSRLLRGWLDTVAVYAAAVCFSGRVLNVAV